MKYVISTIVEGIIVGGLLVSCLLILGIEVTTLEFTFIAITAFTSTGFASWVANLIKKGGTFYEWMMYYNGHSIVVKIGTKAGELYINDTMLDRNAGVWKNKNLELKAVLESGEKITAIISAAKAGEVIKTDRSLNCELLIDGKPLRMAAA